MKSRVKIKDIAARCGLSNTLVSLVLNDKASLHGIKPDTQEKVLFVARQMGYFDDLPIDNAKNISRNMSHVAMIVPAVNDHFLFRISPLLKEAFSSIGLHLSVIPSGDNPGIFRREFFKLMQFYTGMILYSSSADDQIIRDMKSSDYPFVVLENADLKHRVHLVKTDEKESAGLVASHLSSLAYKKIAVIEDSEGSNCIIKRSILENAIREENGVIDITWLGAHSKLMDDDRLKTAIMALLKPPGAVQLFIIKDAAMVYPLVSLFKQNRLRIPSDIAIMSLEEGIGFSLLDPPITRLRRSCYPMALKTSQILWTEIKNRGRGKYKRLVNINSELVVEKSCGSVH